MKRSSNPECFLSPEEKQQIEAAVAAAEKKTSAEIKVVLARHCWRDIREKAIQIFTKHELHETAERNCVLILLVLANREFLIFGDKGIHEKAGQKLWDSVRNEMAELFRQDKFGEGLAAGVEAVGKKLIEFFPIKDDDQNEISNEVAYED
jgi:uncharacterized membrane protein